jgi:hypothetical protein
MRRTLLTIALVASVTTMALPASAAGPVTRTGAQYSGVRNPGNCEVKTEGNDLHVKCRAGVDASGPAFIRFRFLADVGGVLGPATVSADLRDAAGCATYRWMAPIRTMRVEVPFGCYIHIRSVTWQQP